MSVAYTAPRASAADLALARQFAGSLEHAPAARSVDELTDADLAQPERTAEEGFRCYPNALHPQAFLAAFRGHQYAAQLARSDIAAILFRWEGQLYDRMAMNALHWGNEEFYRWRGAARPGQVHANGCQCVFSTQLMLDKYLHATRCPPALAMQIDANKGQWT